MSLSSKLIVLFTVTTFFLSSLAQVDPSTPVTPGTVCQSTPDPSYCKSVLPNNRIDTYNYGRFSVRQSLYQSIKFLNLIQKNLNRYGSSLPAPAVGALEDCSLLASLNIDYVSSSLRVMATTNKTLPVSKADDIQTYLSAALTNQQTCLDGLQSAASAINNRIVVPLANDTKLNSVTLALFTKAWVPKTRRAKRWKPKKKRLPFGNGKPPMKMPTRARAVYETFAGRKLLQTTNSSKDQVLISDVVTVAQDGSGNFTTINDAVTAAPNNTNGTNGYFLIYVSSGVYEEYVSIGRNKKYLMMVGDGISKTIITGNRSVADGSTTFNSSTFAVVASNFVAVDITFKNTAGPVKGQAVAVRNGADLSTFYNCSFEAYQDTLYAHSLRQFYRECDIYGTVDFIFGNAAAVFQNCNIYPRLPLTGQSNVITAQGRIDPNQNTGMSIQYCNIKAADDLALSGANVRTYLGRPWKLYSRTVYMQNFMDGLINPSGWDVWIGDFALSTLYYAEFNNTGPGSDTKNRVTWPGYHVINATDAGNFTVPSFLMGDTWLPNTGVPYTD